MTQHPSKSSVDREAKRASATDGMLIGVRQDVARFTSKAFATTGQMLHVLGHLIGSDRVEGRSPFGHRSDETVAVSVLLRIGSELVSASTDLFADGRHYAASALLRQLVEIEYLAWAFETRDQEVSDGFAVPSPSVKPSSPRQSSEAPREADSVVKTHRLVLTHRRHVGVRRRGGPIFCRVWDATGGH